MPKSKQPKIDPEERISAKNRERIEGFKRYINLNEKQLEKARLALQTGILYPEILPYILFLTMDENGGMAGFLTQKAMLEEGIKKIEEVLNNHKEGLRMAQDEEDIMDFIKAAPDGDRMFAFAELPPLNRWAVLRAFARKGLISKEMMDIAEAMHKGQSEGGKTTAELKKNKADEDKSEIHKIADECLNSKPPKTKCAISGLIMKRTGFLRKKVLDALHSHPSGLWPAPSKKK